MKSKHIDTALVIQTGMHDKTINVRLPEELLNQADDLIPLLSNNEQLRLAGRITRSTVIRLAVHRGMQDLLKIYGKNNNATKGLDSNTKVKPARTKKGRKR